MEWVKLGRVFEPNGRLDWMATHASLPVPVPSAASPVRVLFGCRDRAGRSQTGWVDLDRTDPTRVLAVSETPVLPLGPPGTFDEDGIMPSSVVEVGDESYLYYIGWSRQVTVPYRLAMGLAIRRSGQEFVKVSEGPILDRAVDEPYFNTAPAVLRHQGRWRMWYVSTTGWTVVRGHPEPLYRIRHAESADGIAWSRGPVCLDYDSSADAFGRPWVFVEDGRYKMLYSYRRAEGYRTDPERSYRLGYAESADGLVWERRDAEVGLSRSPSGWDSEMIEYSAVLQQDGRTFLFYNGNGFGKTGFGVAIRP